jgi:hypothetical protein
MSDRLYVTDDGIIIDLEMVCVISGIVDTRINGKQFLVFHVFVFGLQESIKVGYSDGYEFGEDFSDLEDFVNWQKNDLYDAWNTYLGGGDND